MFDAYMANVLIDDNRAKEQEFHCSDEGSSDDSGSELDVPQEQPEREGDGATADFDMPQEQEDTVGGGATADFFLNMDNDERSEKEDVPQSQPKKKIKQQNFSDKQTSFNRPLSSSKCSMTGLVCRLLSRKKNWLKRLVV